MYVVNILILLNLNTLYVDIKRFAQNQGAMGKTDLNTLYVDIKQELENQMGVYYEI